MLIIKSYKFAQIELPIFNHCYDDYLTLPARSQVIRRIKVNAEHQEILIPNQEIHPGIFVANTIAKSNDTYVKILNSTKNDITIKTNLIQTENLNNYEVHKVDSDGTNRKEKVLKHLSKNFPKLFKPQLTNICSEFSDIFGLESETISSNNFYKQKLKLKDKTPTYIKNYRTPHSQIDKIDEEIKKLIDEKIVEPSTSEYNSPLLLVPKKSLPGSKDKRWRLVIDYRQVNKKLIADKFPLPRIDDILDQLGRAKYFSCLDLMSGFHQIELDKDSRDITSFSSNKGSYRFTRLPYGLKIAPNSFQRMMSLAFAGLNPSQAFLYMDDLVVIGCSEKHMLKNLRDVFELCRKHNLKLHPDKCSFFMHEVTYLGHKCTSKGILPDDSKYSAIKNYPTPTNAEEAKRFVAFCNYYRRFIKNFANYARHITRLTKKNVDFVWSEDCEKSFQYLKTALMSPQLLQYPDFTKKFIITTDASKLACGAVLSQEYDGKLLPVSYASKSFTPGESKKSTIEQELTAIHWAIKYFRPYIYGTNFSVQTDHRPLTYLFSMKDPSSKLTRMRLDLEEYDFDIGFLRGKNNYVADALSRISIEELKTLTQQNNRILKVITRSEKIKNEKVPEKLLIKENEIIKPKIYEVISAADVRKSVKLTLTSNQCILKHGKMIIDKIIINDLFDKDIFDLDQFFPRLESMANKHNLKKLKMAPNEQIFEYVQINEFKEKGNKILRNLRVALLPKVTTIQKSADIKDILNKYHDDPILGGHCGITKTKNKIRKYYFWKNMTRDITKYIKSCDKCQKAKVTKHTKASMTITDTPTKAFDTVLVDTIGPLPKSTNGNEYAITLICDLTKYLVTVPIPDKTAKTVAKSIFDKFVLVYGPMKKLISDMGTEYKNQLLQDLCKYMKVQNVTSTAHHHQTLGTVEKSHRTLNEYLRSFISIDRDDWDTNLPYFTYCFNTTPSAVHNYCPYELVYGKNPPLFLNLKTSNSKPEPIYNIDDYSKEVKYRLELSLIRARKLIQEKKLKYKEYYDRNKLEIDIKIGDQVLLRNDTGHKLENKYVGPLEVVRIDEDGNVLVLGDKNKKQLVHRNRLKIYYK